MHRPAANSLFPSGLTPKPSPMARDARLSQTALGAKESGEPGDRLALELPPQSSIA